MAISISMAMISKGQSLQVYIYESTKFPRKDEDDETSNESFMKVFSSYVNSNVDTAESMLPSKSTPQHKGKPSPKQRSSAFDAVPQRDDRSPSSIRCTSKYPTSAESVDTSRCAEVEELQACGGPITVKGLDVVGDCMMVQEQSNETRKIPMSNPIATRLFSYTMI